MYLFNHELILRHALVPIKFFSDVRPNNKMLINASASVSVEVCPKELTMEERELNTPKSLLAEEFDISGIDDPEKNA